MAQQLVGTVVSTKMQKTIVVQIERKFRHPLYRKVITRHKKIKAHVENNDVQEGDVVTIQETKPISKDKHFIFINKISSTTVKSEKPAKKTVAAPKTKSSSRRKSKSK